MSINFTKNKILTNLVLFFSVFILSSEIFAEGKDLATLSKDVQTQVKSLATLLTVVAYVAGVGFALSGIVKFRAHQLSPQSTPLSQPITMIIIAAALLFLPTVMETAGQTVFGGGQQKGTSFTVE